VSIEDLADSTVALKTALPSVEAVTTTQTDKPALTDDITPLTSTISEFDVQELVNGTEQEQEQEESTSVVEVQIDEETLVVA
jgi:hypothetical protein